MINKVLAIMFMIVVSTTVNAQTATPEPDDEPFTERARVQVESVFVRAKPDVESPMMTSVFLDDILIVIGRNIDGAWFEVKRPGRNYNLGWIEHKWLDWDFRSEDLPLTDSTTGLDGDTPPEDTGYAVFVIDNVTMRDIPLVQGNRILVVPHSVVVPVIARNQDGAWLQINYRGHVGWIVAFATRIPEELYTIPQAPNLPPIPERIIIPPEVQLAHVAKLRIYVEASTSVASGLANLWGYVADGDVMPCNPPDFVQEYLYTEFDVRELPELDRIVPRLDEGLAMLNASIETLNQCGVIDIEAVNEAKSNAINARIIFDNALSNLDYVESIIR